LDLATSNDQLRKEQDRYAQVEKQRSNFETHIKDLEYRLEEAESSAAKNSKKVAVKFEQRISELQVVIDAELRRTDEAHKLVKKHERRIKELLSQADEEQKAKLLLQDTVDQLQQTTKAFKSQVEEAVS